LGPLAHLHKEWLHYCVAGRDIELLLNFSIARRARNQGSTNVGRVIALVRADGAWSGGTESFTERDIHCARGLSQVVLGSCSAQANAHGLQLKASLPQLGLWLELMLVPETESFVRRPLLRAPVCWGVVPRLRAWGSLRSRDAVHVFDGDPAYHDHNWGGFRWGDDFLWQWCTALPRLDEGPYGVVFSRLFDRKGLTETGRSVLVWRAEQLLRVFHDENIRFSQDGYLTQKEILNVPSVMHLLVPGTTTGVPKTLHFEARSGADFLQGTATMQDVARIVIPNETDLGVTVINECSCRLVVQGSIRGLTVRQESRAIFEHLTAPPAVEERP